MNQKKKNNLIRYLLIILSLLALVASGLIWSRGYDHNERKNQRSKKFDQLDKKGGFFSWESADANEDDRVTQEEVEDFATRIFSDFDVDNDESLSLEEFTSHILSRREKLAELIYRKLKDDDMEKIKERSEDAFSRMDEDEDGYISNTEFYGKRIEKIFDRFDRDGDGVTDKNESRRRRK